MILGMQISHVMALLLGGLACAFDLRTRRIPNVLTFGGAAVGLVYAFTSHGFSGLLASLEGWGVGLALFLPMFLLGGMGAGDVKLLACLGAWVGPFEAVWVAIYLMVAGGVMGMITSLAGYAPGRDQHPDVADLLARRGGASLRN
jgi:prepilin peptidase CpaA